MTLIIFENNKLLFGLIPESLVMLVFGIALITLAISLRWFLARFEAEVFPESEPARNLSGFDTRSAGPRDGRFQVSER